jgi:hypothetical protein
MRYTLWHAVVILIAQPQPDAYGLCITIVILLWRSFAFFNRSSSTTLLQCYYLLTTLASYWLLIDGSLKRTTGNWNFTDPDKNF